MKERKENKSTLLVALVLGWELFRWAAHGVQRVFTADRVNTAPTAAEIASEEQPEKSRRAADRNVETSEQRSFRKRWGTIGVLSGFAAGAAGGIGFLITYWSGSSNEIMGVTLALLFGGLGVGLVLAAHNLMPHKEASEPRETLQSSQREVQAFAEDLGADIERRGMLKWMGAVVALILGAGVLSLLRSLGKPPDPSLLTLVWKRGQRLVTSEGRPLTVQSLSVGSSVTVFPEGSIGKEDGQTVLVRVDEHALALPSDRRDWAPMGYVAYSRICTHAGCPVGLFEAENDLLLCPCHQSTFDVLRGGCPTAGPAARPLPQLPLYADSDGNLRAGAGFSEPPGPGFWGMP